MHDVCVLFFHHKSDDTTRHNLATIRHHNPDVPVIPVFCRDGGPCDPLPGAVEVRRTDGTNNWFGSDAVFLEWFRSNRVEAERYIWCEWDTHCTGSIRDFYSDVWQADIAAANTLYPGQDDWDWFHSSTEHMTADWVPYMAGVSPLCGVMLSRRAIEAMAAEPLPHGVFCETRLATLAHWCGFPLTKLPEHRGKMIEYQHRGSRTIGTTPGLYHPVRQLTRQQLADPPASASVVVLPHFGEFGWLVARHVRWVEQLQSQHKVVCCRPGEECLFPSASGFVHDWPEGIPDSQRCEDGSGDDDACRKLLRERYPSHLLVRPEYPNPWAWDHSAIRIDPQVQHVLAGVDVVLCPRHRDHGVTMNWQHWSRVATELRAAGYSVGLVGRRDASDAEVPCDAMAWHHPGGATAGTIDLLTHCKLYVATDTGVSHLATMLGVPTLLVNHPVEVNRWTQVDLLRRSTSGPFDVLPVSAWTDPAQVVAAALAKLPAPRARRSAVTTTTAPPRSSSWVDGQGERLWAELHQHQSPTTDWLASYGNRIPCGPCKSHWVELVRDHPATFSPLRAWRAWTVEAHNRVNMRIGKPAFSFAQAAARWGWNGPGLLGQ